MIRVIIFFSLIIITLSCGKTYYSEIPYKFIYDQKLIIKKLNLDKLSIYSEKDNLNLYQNLTDQELYIKEKYSIILSVSPKDLTNYKFYGFIDKWIHTPYAKVGFKKDSLNIASFASELYNYTYNKKLPTNALGIFNSKEIIRFTNRESLEEGDILFFRYNKKNPIGDIGIYLKNDRILISSKKHGLIITDFKRTGYYLAYVCAGRLILENK